MDHVSPSSDVRIVPSTPTPTKLTASELLNSNVPENEVDELEVELALTVIVPVTACDVEAPVKVKAP